MLEHGGSRKGGGGFHLFCVWGAFWNSPFHSEPFASPQDEGLTPPPLSPVPTNEQQRGIVLSAQTSVCLGGPRADRTGSVWQINKVQHSVSRAESPQAVSDGGGVDVNFEVRPQRREGDATATP